MTGSVWRMHFAVRRALQGRRAKLLALGASGALGGGALLLQSSAGVVVAALGVIYVVGPRAEAVIRERLAVRRTRRRRLAAQDEVVLGAFSQTDRLVGAVEMPGELAMLLASEPGHHQPRSRHIVEVVSRGDALLIRKTYGDYRGRKLRARWFAQEVAALERLDALDRVPSLVEVRPRELVLYQTFFRAPTLAVVLEQHGIPFAIQQRVRSLYRGLGRRTAEQRSEVRRVSSVLGKVLGVSFLAALHQLVERVHDMGVLMGDVKYGNVLVDEDGPRLIDFDLARVYRPGSGSFRLARENEMDLFRYTFGFEESA